MVKGLDTFKEYFQNFSEQYVLIGGAACDLSFHEGGVDFRATKEFGQKFWQFIKEGGYRNRARSDGTPQFYRFEKPEDARFPKMIELFARKETILYPDAAFVPLYIDDDVSSLSAILLNEEYYRLLMKGRVMVDGISILNASCLIPFKAKAWLDLRERQNAGKHVDSRDIKKHRNDVLRIAAELPLEEIELSAAIKEEMSVFIAAVRKDNPDIKTLGLKNIKLEDILKLLEEIYCKK